MDPVLKEKWVAALRSGKYQQGTGRLRRTSPPELPCVHCCLGVLCDISGRGVWTNGKHDTDCFQMPVDDPKCDQTDLLGDAYLPHALAREIGISPIGRFDVGTDIGGFANSLGVGRVLRLADLNDNGFTFNQIADLIEYFM